MGVSIARLAPRSRGNLHIQRTAVSYIPGTGRQESAGCLINDCVRAPLRIVSLCERQDSRSSHAAALVLVVEVPLYFRDPL